MEETEAPAPMFLNAEETLVFIDIETFGLDVETDPPIEIGFVITDLDLNVLHKNSWYIWEDYYDDRLAELQDLMAEGDKGSKIVFEMHRDSSLWSEAELHGADRLTVEQNILGWFKEIGLPEHCNLVGSSVHFDYYNSFFNLGRMQEYFHHRIFDISAIKVLIEKYAPKTAKRLKEQIEAKKRHRVMDDLDDTMSEFRFYLGIIKIDNQPIWED
jgi:oligoribonuclease (3'-5' exoribonuclease)